MDENKIRRKGLGPGFSYVWKGQRECSGQYYALGCWRRGHRKGFSSPICCRGLVFSQTREKPLSRYNPRKV